MARTRARSPLLIEALTALGRLRVRETQLIDPRGRHAYRWHGLLEGDVIYVNPSWAIADTLIHEALHAIRPQWSERAIRSWTSRLLGQLSDDEAWRLWQWYCRQVRE